jgi:hypothetical protein
MGSDEEEEFIPANKMSAYAVFMGWAYYKVIVTERKMVADDARFDLLVYNSLHAC